MKPGDTVKFAAHGDTGLTYRVITVDGDDVCLQDIRGRLLPNVPVELLVLLPASGAIREVDQMR